MHVAQCRVTPARCITPGPFQVAPKPVTHRLLKRKSRHTCQAAGRSGPLDNVKLSKKDEKELRDLMPTDENLLDTSQSELSHDEPESAGSLSSWTSPDASEYQYLLDSKPTNLHLTDVELAQLEYDVAVRQEAIIDAAEQHAIWLHHEQVERGGNVYAMTNWIADRLDDIEFEDAYIQQEELTMIPSWVRAFHDLEYNWEEFLAERTEVEQAAEKSQARIERRQQAQELGIPFEEDEELEEEEPDPLDGLLEGILPGTGETADTEEFMQELLPDQLLNEPEIHDFDNSDPDMYSRSFTAKRME